MFYDVYISGGGGGMIWKVFNEVEWNAGVTFLVQVWQGRLEGGGDKGGFVF